MEEKWLKRYEENQQCVVLEARTRAFQGDKRGPRGQTLLHVP